MVPDGDDFSATAFFAKQTIERGGGRIDFKNIEGPQLTAV
jgi:hypothetical protein